MAVTQQPSGIVTCSTCPSNALAEFRHRPFLLRGPVHQFGGAVSPDQDAQYLLRKLRMHFMSAYSQWPATPGSFACISGWVPWEKAAEFGLSNDIGRISFPDFYRGCTDGDDGTPRGPRRCDISPTTVYKIRRKDLADAWREMLVVCFMCCIFYVMHYRSYIICNIICIS